MEVKRSKWFKTLAAFLAFVMVIQILPLSVLADELMIHLRNLFQQNKSLIL